MQMLLTRPQKIRHPAIVIQPQGGLNAENAIQFYSKLNVAISSNLHSGLLIDMQHVELIDSAGLMALVSAFRLAKNSNKQFHLCSVSHSVRMILELTQLDQVLEIIASPASVTSSPV